MKTYSILILLFISCLSVPRVSLLKKRPQQATIPFNQLYLCKEMKEAYLGEKEHVTHFQKMLDRIKGLQLNPFERFVLWSFSQMFLRPDQLSPHSSLNLLIIHGGKEYLYQSQKQDPSHKNTLFPILRKVLSQSPNSRSLDKLSYLFEEYYPSYVPVGESFASFLQENQEKLRNSKDQYEYLFRGDDILREGESLKRFSISNYLRLNSKKNSIIKRTTINIKQDISCNNNAERYFDGFINPASRFQKAYSFGYRLGRTIILASSMQVLDVSQKKEARSLILPDSSLINTTPFCRFLSKNGPLWLSSSYSQDPPQILSQLYGYNIQKAKDYKQINQLIRFSRHLVLQNPTRILYESQRGSEEQLAKLNALSAPIYHSKNIGEVTGVIYTKDQNAHFLLDDRSDIRENCN